MKIKSESELKQYTLMHRDIPVALLALSKDDGMLIKYKPLDMKHAPIGINSETAMREWWKRRAIPQHQQGKAALLNGSNNLKYMIDNLSLSLIDNYWAKPIDEFYYWKDINLYEHNFKESDFSFANLDNLSPFKPSATTQGELQKRWVIDKKGDRYLVKGNYDNAYRQSINEVLATRLHDLQDIDHTHYNLIELPTTMGQGLGCISKNFTTPNLEFVPAYDITFYDKCPNDESIYEHYINTCVKLGIDRDEMQCYMDYQIMSDFLLTNTDRHLLNLGVLRDAETLQFVKPAPIFDTGNAMFYRINYIPNEVYKIPITSFYKTEMQMLKQVKDKTVLNLDKIPTISELKELYSKDPYSVVYLPNLLEGYEKKIEMIDAYQRGYSLNPRSQTFYENIPNWKEKDTIELD